MHNVNKFDDMYVSINEEINNKTKTNNEKIVCLKISNLIFSFRLSFIIDLYSFIPLTANAMIQGIKMRFCNNKVDAKNNIPFPVPHIAIAEEMVYPKQKPLNATIPMTNGIPITVEPANHMKSTKITLLVIDFFNNCNWSISEPFFKEVVKSLK